MDAGLYIYVLELEGGCYYVGKTKSPTVRIEDHRTGGGSLWTTIHPVVNVVEIIPGDTFDEDKYVKKYMATYGIDMVRGGSYCREHLSKEDYSALEKELLGAADACFKCGKRGHFARDCRAKPKAATKVCKKCGRDTHTAKDCYATTHQDGSKIASKPKVKNCKRCGRPNHTAKGCYAKTDINGEYLPPN